VVSNRATPTVEGARAITDRLVQSFPSVDAVLLCGSVARHDANEWSDVDLIVIGSDAELKVQQLREALPEPKDRVSLIYYPTTGFQELCHDRALFIAHLKKEGVVLYDRLNLLATIMNQSFTPFVNINEELAAHRARLAPYTDPRRFNNNFLFCLSHLYSIGKGVIMLGLARKGVLEFNRDAAFQRFASLNPDLAEEAQKVAQLRPFYRLVTDRQPEPLPFSYRSAERQMQEVVRAIQTLAKHAEGQ
jgi:predicted nucleotidyltransferase